MESSPSMAVIERIMHGHIYEHKVCRSLSYMDILRIYVYVRVTRTYTRHHNNKPCYSVTLMEWLGPRMIRLSSRPGRFT